LDIPWEPIPSTVHATSKYHLQHKKFHIYNIKNQYLQNQNKLKKFIIHPSAMRKKTALTSVSDYIKYSKSLDENTLTSVSDYIKYSKSLDENTIFK